MKSQTTSFSRYRLLWIITLCYLLPLIAICAYPLINSGSTPNWDTLSIGLLLSCIGSLIIFWMMSRLESVVYHPKIKAVLIPQDASSTNTPNPLTFVEIEKYTSATQSIDNLQKRNEELDLELETLNQQLKEMALKHEQADMQVRHATLELEDHHQSTFQQLEEQQQQILALQNTIAEQKSQLDKRNQQMGTLETKVGDLTYEIKTLLKLAESHSSSLSDLEESSPSSSVLPDEEERPNTQTEKMISRPEEASNQLKRCLDIAQKITGSQRFNSHVNPLLNSAADNFTLDLRRLCDSLRSENSCTIILYSPKNNQILFVNNQIKTLTGWSPEKFTQHFPEILQDPSSWKQGITNLATRSEAQVKLTLKTRSGQETLVSGHLGLIPTGIFRQHAIAVLYSTQPAILEAPTFA